MVRAPCCWARGLKKGPWTHEEDEILKSFVEKHGHDNWRALPQLAGLLRCGKSCRLRWLNYLRPEVKLGNFTKEEDEIIIKMHAAMGNKWSAMAAQLPGRTDNELKNRWHTRLKKKMVVDMEQPRSNDNYISESSQEQPLTLEFPPGSEVESSTAQLHVDLPFYSPQYSSHSEISPVLASGATYYEAETTGAGDIDLINSLGYFLELDGSFLLDPIPAYWDFASHGGEMLQDPEQVDVVPDFSVEAVPDLTTSNYDQIDMWHAAYPNVISDDVHDFWYDLFVSSLGLEQLFDEFSNL